MVNNFELIKNFLFFEDKDDFYFCQILKRKKENPDLKSDSVVIDTITIENKEKLEKIEHKIIDKCVANNARAYINLNKRNYKKIATRMVQYLGDSLANEDYRSAKMAFESTCGKYSSEKEKKWIIDIDNVNNLIPIKNFLNKINSENQDIGKIYLEVPTKNGLHLITSGFNPNLFSKEFKEEIKKDNPTLLFAI